MVNDWYNWGKCVPESQAVCQWLNNDYQTFQINLSGNLTYYGKEKASIINKEQYAYRTCFNRNEGSAYELDWHQFSQDKLEMLKQQVLEGKTEVQKQMINWMLNGEEMEPDWMEYEISWEERCGNVDWNSDDFPADC